MAGFQTKVWKNRVSEHGNRRKLTLVSGENDVYDVTREEGTISEPGDAFSATNMNDLESRIAAVATVLVQSATLSTSQDTTVVFSDESITTNSILSFYNSIYGLNPIEVSVASGSVILTFEPYDTAATIQVGVKIEGEYSV